MGIRKELKNSGDVEDFIQGEVERIREVVGEKRVICALSGGVDSSVAALLVHRAVGDQLVCVFVDHGLLRKNEGEEVRRIFESQHNIDLRHVDAKDRFFTKLKSVDNPEKKRKVIGEEFIRVFEEEAEKLGDISYLVQGTLYSDVAESGTKDSAGVKSHHNVGGLPEDMEFQLIEPLRSLLKDEVRRVGEGLGLSQEIVQRQPFPGPGLAIRIAGDVTEEKVRIVRHADSIVTQEIGDAGLPIWQAFAILLDIKSVGVTENRRTYAYPVVVRVVDSRDAMTAHWTRLPHELMERISHRITREVDGVNRVLLDITSKPPATIEWE
ncbi:MAG: glutamine-hydrolyzing GMP synthase [Clostridia bacterium]|nr:glutamine-hydrolyzing GMP synthase [Clostridia bacterium]